MNKNHNSLPIAPLFVPGNRQDMLNKVINMDVEWVIPDLEDSVPLSEKEYARDITKKSIINLINSGICILSLRHFGPLLEWHIFSVHLIIWLSISLHVLQPSNHRLHPRSIQLPHESLSNSHLTFLIDQILTFMSC